MEMSGSVVVVANTSSFESYLSRPGLVVADFTATWCGPCKRIAPTFSNLSNEYPNVTFLKVDIDENEELANRFSITGVPAFVFFKSGQEVTRIVGANEAKLKESVQSWA